MNAYEKRKYISENKNKYIIEISKEQKDLMASINEFRYERNINELIYEKKMNFEDLVCDKYAEPFLFNDKNIFKLSFSDYLFIYPINEFKKRYNKDKNIINILLNNYCKKIIIFVKDGNEYIFLFQSKRNASRNNYNDSFRDEIKISTEKGIMLYSRSKYYDY